MWEDIRCEITISLDLVHSNTNLDSTVDFTVKHKVSPNHPFIIINLVHVFRKVEFDFAEYILVIGRR